MGKWLVGLAFLGFCWASSTADAQSALPMLTKGMVFEGTYNRAEPGGAGKKAKELNTDAQLKITHSDDKTWEGELWVIKGSLGMKVKGEIKEKGVMTMGFEKELKGTWRKDLIGKGKGYGKLNQDKIDLKIGIAQQDFVAQLLVTLKK